MWKNLKYVHVHMLEPRSKSLRGDTELFWEKNFKFMPQRKQSFRYSACDILNL